MADASIEIDDIAVNTALGSAAGSKVFLKGSICRQSHHCFTLGGPSALLWQHCLLSALGPDAAARGTSPTVPPTAPVRARPPVPPPRPPPRPPRPPASPPSMSSYPVMLAKNSDEVTPGQWLQISSRVPGSGSAVFRGHVLLSRVLDSS